MGDRIDVRSLADIGCTADDIPETLSRAVFSTSACGMSAATVMLKRALPLNDTAPGHDSAANMARLLREMEGVTDRRARFRTVIALLRGGRLTLVEGIVNGTIATSPSGSDGFGYDPVFIPEGSDRSFAQMSAEEKKSL